MSLAPEDGSANTDSKKPVHLKSVIRGMQTVSDRVKQTAAEKLKEASEAMNSRDPRQAWMDLILRKEFDQMLDETFDKCSGINVAHDADDSLDANELAVAMEILYKRLDEMSGSQESSPSSRNPCPTSSPSTTRTTTASSTGGSSEGSPARISVAWSGRCGRRPRAGGEGRRRVGGDTNRC